MLLFGAFVASSMSSERDPNFSNKLEEWQNFKQQHGKIYETSNFDALRRSIFAYNKYRIDKFNREDSERLGFSLAVNERADMGAIEARSYNGYKARPGVSSEYRSDERGQQFLADILARQVEVPDAVDWRNVSGRVSHVKNQGQCGSCWAFSAVGALEGQEKVWKKSNESIDKNLVELSEQNLVDCVKDDAGCNGGLMQDAFEWVKQEGGIDDEQSYPYEARTRKCRFRKDKVAFTDTGATMLPSGDEQQLKEVVAKFGPVSVGIDASSMWFQFYKKGVYNHKHCKNKENQLDHGVLVVGYGTDPKQGDYWIVKNSWGPKWGEKGYIRMARNRKNQCGIATAASIPTF